MKLCEALNHPTKKEMVVKECVEVIENEVAGKSGISGLALKTGYKAIKGIKPGFVPTVIDHLMPEALAALDPIWSEGVQTGDPVTYLTQNSDRAANALLTITDEKVKHAHSKVLRGTYNKLRHSLNKDVEEAIPALAGVIDKYTKA